MGLCYGTRPDGVVQPCWDKGDEIVVTTTDYLPGHSEKLRIQTIVAAPSNQAVVTFDALDDQERIVNTGVRWRHNGVRYGGPKDPQAVDRPG